MKRRRIFRGKMRNCWDWSKAKETFAKIIWKYPFWTTNYSVRKWQTSSTPASNRSRQTITSKTLKVHLSWMLAQASVNSKRKRPQWNRNWQVCKITWNNLPRLWTNQKDHINFTQEPKKISLLFPPKYKDYQMISTNKQSQQACNAPQQIKASTLLTFWNRQYTSTKCCEMHWSNYNGPLKQKWNRWDFSTKIRLKDTSDCYKDNAIKPTKSIHLNITRAIIES